MAVTAFILNFNLADLLERCVVSLLQQSAIDEILIMDNDSTTDLQTCYAVLAQRCAQEKVDFRVEYVKPMISFAEAQNWGLDSARNNLVLLMNNDAYFKVPDSLDTSIQIINQNPNAYLVGHQIINSDGSLNHAGAYYNFRERQFDHLGRDRNREWYQQQRDVLAVTAACVLVRRSILRMDTAYWFHYEDTDFCLQHWQKGQRCIYNPNVLIVHDESTTRGVKRKSDPIWEGKHVASAQYVKQRWAPSMPKIYWFCLNDNIMEHSQTYAVTIGTQIGIAGLCVCLVIRGGWQLLTLSILSFGVAKYIFVGLIRLYVRARRASASKSSAAA